MAAGPGEAPSGGTPPGSADEPLARHLPRVDDTAGIRVEGQGNITLGAGSSGNAVGLGATIITVISDFRPLVIALLGLTTVVVVVAALTAARSEAVALLLLLVAGAVLAAGAGALLWTRKSPARQDVAMPYVGKGERERRRSLIDQVDKLWVQDSLNQSLRAAVRLEVGLVDQPDAVLESWGSEAFQRLVEGRRLAVGTRLASVLAEDDDRRLLLVGAPGAGKTTLLLGLAADQVVAARASEHAPAPCVLLLSTWVDGPGGLADWICAEALKRYLVPASLMTRWMETGSVFLLLDGLDEVRGDGLERCLGVIQEFCSNPRFADCGLALTCRTEEFEAQGRRLRVRRALGVLPLSEEQVDGVLTAGAHGTAALRAVAAREPGLATLLRTPLMLGIAVLAFAHRPPGTNLPPGELRTALFGLYVHRMLYRVRALRARAEAAAAGPVLEAQEAYYALVWLARLMSRRQQTILYPDLLTPMWLPDRLPPWPLTRQKGLRARVARLLGWDHTSTGLVGGQLGAIAGALSAAPLGLLAHGAVGAAVSAGVGAALLGGGVALAFGVLFQSPKAELLSAPLVGRDIYGIFAATNWRWSFTTGVHRSAGRWVFLCIIIGSPLALAGTPSAAVLAVLAVVGVGGLLSGGNVPDHEHPPPVVGSALEASLRRLAFLLAVLLCGVAVGVVVLATMGGPWPALLAALPATAAYMLTAGPGRAWLRFHAARYGIKHAHLLPADVDSLLRHGVERVLLRRVGGGYMFLHRDLQEFLAGCDPENLTEPTLLTP